MVIVSLPLPDHAGESIAAVHCSTDCDCRRIDCLRSTHLWDVTGRRSSRPDSDPWMALDPRDRVHFAYLEYDPNGGSLPPCGSGLDVSNTSDGQDWGTVHYIPGLGGLVDKDSIAFDSAGRLYAAWDEGNTLALSWSDDDGTHWAPIRNPGNVGHSVLGAVVATFENSTVYLTWWDIDTNNIMFESSSNRGQTWSP